MKKLDPVVKSLIHALGVLVYVFVVAWVLYSKETFGEPPGLLIPVFMLLLLILSATITGLLVLGKPLYLYFNGFKKEAMVMLFATVGWLVVFLIAVVVALLVQ